MIAMTILEFDKELTITACIRPNYVDQVFASDHIRQSIKRALEKILRAKYHTLTIDFKLELEIIGHCDNDAIVTTNEELSLIKSEAIASKFVKEIYISSVEHLQLSTNELNLSDQLGKLSIEEDDCKAIKLQHFKLSECKLMIFLYYNLDQTPVSSLIDLEIDIEDILSRDEGLNHFPCVFEKFSKDTFDSTIITSLPNSKLDSKWEEIYLDFSLKSDIFRHSKLGFKLSKLDLHCQSLGNCKMILLCGPPGTGKTTICKTISHKISTEYLEIFDNNGGVLIEFNCSRLFSRWFGESSLKISNLFNDIENLASFNNIMIILLIDEVETLASSRSKLIDQNESADGIRVVNTLLTHIDRLKKHDNIIIFATSNLASSIDPAFIDRCDSIFTIGNPSTQVIFQLLQAKLNEFISLGIIVQSSMIKSYEWCELNKNIECQNPGCLLLKICERLKEQKRSGRFVSKMAVTALAGQKVDAIKKPIAVYLTNLISLL